MKWTETLVISSMITKIATVIISHKWVPEQNEAE